MKLPDKFIEKYRNLLGQEADDFLATFDQEAISGFRVNPLKKTQHANRGRKKYTKSSIAL